MGAGCAIASDDGSRNGDLAEADEALEKENCFTFRHIDTVQRRSEIEIEEEKKEALSPRGPRGNVLNTEELKQYLMALEMPLLPAQQVACEPSSESSAFAGAMLAGLV